MSAKGCLFKKNATGIVTPEWAPGIDPADLARCTIRELTDGVTVYVRKGLWMAKRENGDLAIIPLAISGRPFFEALINWLDGYGAPNMEEQERLPDGGYELIGPGIKENPYETGMYVLIPHDMPYPSELIPAVSPDEGALTYWREYAKFMLKAAIEGFVWVLDGEPYATLRRSDFGLPWPVAQPNEPSPPSMPSEPGE